MYVCNLQTGPGFQRFGRAQLLTLRRRANGHSGSDGDMKATGRLRNQTLQSANAADWLHDRNKQNAAAGGGSGGGGAAQPSGGEHVKLAAAGFGKRQRQQAGPSKPNSELAYSAEQHGSSAQQAAGSGGNDALSETEQDGMAMPRHAGGGGSGATTVAFGAEQRLRAASDGAHAAAGKLNAALHEAVHGHASRRRAEVGAGSLPGSLRSGGRSGGAIGGSGSRSAAGGGSGSGLDGGGGSGGDDSGGSSRGRPLGRLGEPARCT